jgi:hypothetical protein
MECPVDGCTFESDSGVGIRSHCGHSHSDSDNPFRKKCKCDFCGKYMSIKKNRYNENGNNYCSDKCSASAKKKRVDCECNYCGKDFEVKKSSYERGEGKYCSKKCRGLDERKRVECECINCSEKFTVTESHYDKYESKYCSKDCYIEYKNVICECNYCGKELTMWKSRYEKSEKTYCSIKCQALDNRCVDPDLRKSPEYKQFRQTVLERDNHRCVECGDDTNIHVHHIVPIYEDGSLATDVKNGKTLCVNCHADEHRQMGDDGLAVLIESEGDYTEP